MKKEGFIKFKEKLESKKPIFDIPNLPDCEFEYILYKAKVESKCSTNRNKNTSSFFCFSNLYKNTHNLFFSLKFSAFLFCMLTLVVLVGYIFVFRSNSFIKNNYTDKVNTAGRSTIDNTNIVNVSKNGFI